MHYHLLLTDKQGNTVYSFNETGTLNNIKAMALRLCYNSNVYQIEIYKKDTIGGMKKVCMFNFTIGEWETTNKRIIIL